MSAPGGTAVDALITRNMYVLRSMLALEPGVKRVGAYHFHGDGADALALRDAGVLVLDNPGQGLMAALTDTGRERVRQLARCGCDACRGRSDGPGRCSRWVGAA